MDQKGSLDAHAVSRDPANGEVLVDAARTTANDDTFEDLDSLAVPLDDFRVHADGITGAKGRNLGLELFRLDRADQLRDHRAVPSKNYGSPGARRRSNGERA